MFQRLYKSSILRLFSAAVLDQAILSAANFAVGLLLVRYAENTEYGYYVLAFASIQLMLTAQGAWITGPLAVLAPKTTPERRQHMIGAVDHAHHRWMRLLACVLAPIPFATYALGWVSFHDALIATATVFAGWLTLRRDLMRAVLLIYSRPQSLLYADILYATSLVGLATAAALLSPAEAFFCVIAIALSAVLGGWKARAYLTAEPGWTVVPIRPVWLQMRLLGHWGAVGALAHWVYTQSFNFVLAGRLDLDAVAQVNVVRLMLMPMVLLSVGVSALLVPSAAGWLHHEGLSRLIRRLWVFLAGLLALNLGYIFCVWMTRDWLTVTVMQKHIVELDNLLILWSIHMTLGMARDVFQAGVTALERFKDLAGLTAFAAVVSLTTMWFAIGHYGMIGALMGTIAGEAISLVGTAALLAQSARRNRALNTPRVV